MNAPSLKAAESPSEWKPVMKMHHVGISVSNIENSIEFYHDMFGFEQRTPIFPFGGADFSRVMGLDAAAGRMCVIANGSVQLELFEFATPTPVRKNADYPVADHGYSHFGFEIENIEQCHERLLVAGVRFHSPVTVFPSGMKAAYGRDPDGNVFEMLEMGTPPQA